MFTRKYFKMGDFGINDYNALINIVDADSVGDGSATALCKLLMKRFIGDYIVYVDYDPMCEAEPTTTSQDVVVAKQVWDKLMNYIFETTYEKNKLLLEYYADNKAKLMDKLTSVSKTRFNDTPQSTTSIDADNYATTYTKNENEVDFVIIERLASLDRLYKDIYKDWVSEFDRLFIGD